MKNPTYKTAQCIRWMRFARPAIDCSLLLAGLLLFIHFQNMSMQNQIENIASQRITLALKQAKLNTDKQNKPTSVFQQFSNETDMWQEFFEWMNLSKPTSGICRIETRGDVSDQLPYLLQCTGSATGPRDETHQANSRNIPFTSNVLAAAESIVRRPEPQSKVTREKTVTPVDSYTVSGWIHTPTGPKHFDPVSKRWIP